MNHLEIYQKRFEDKIDDYLPSDLSHQGDVYRAIEYSIKATAKRLRPALVYACAETFDIDLDRVDRAAFAIECIHTYSLIHDDLPAMDNDDYRRGQPTCHIKFNEATAILAGDALNTLAFQVLANGKANYSLEQISILSSLAGVAGMVGGQDMDLFAENHSISIEGLTQLHTKKTASLIQASLLLGFQAGEVRCFETLSILNEIGEMLGLYYQIQDDIFDVTKTSLELGKTSCSDIANHKSTYVSLLGLEQARSKLNQLENEIEKKIYYLSISDKPLHMIIKKIIQRQS